MDVKKTLYDLRRKYFGTYEIDDIRETAKANPYTFYMPSQARLDAVGSGDIVKIIIRSVPQSYEYDAERMWVKVTNVNGEDWQGELDNYPFDIPQLKPSDTIKFKSWNVIDIQWKNSEKEKTIPTEPEKQVWDRCLVDQEILNGTARVGYLYREEPDLAGEDDKYPDSGWRIRADERDLTHEELENPKPAYIAIGKVLNEDDSWIHLIESEIGSRILRNADTGKFEVTDYDESSNDE